MSSPVASLVPAASPPASSKPRDGDRDAFQAALDRSAAKTRAGKAEQRQAELARDAQRRADPAALPPGDAAADAAISPLIALAGDVPAPQATDVEGGEGRGPASGFAAALAQTDPDQPGAASPSPTLRERAQQAAPPPPPPPPPTLPAASPAVGLVAMGPPPPSAGAVSLRAGPAKPVTVAENGRTTSTANASAATVVAPAPGEATLTADAVLAVAPGTTGGEPGWREGEGPPADPTLSPAAAALPGAGAAAAPAASAASDLVRGSPETVQSLAAEMVRRLDQRVSRFEVALNPAGLGRVDVRLEIGSKGGLSARLSCDRAGSADALKARGGELAALLQDAGFDVAADGLSFSFAEGGLSGGDLAQAGAEAGGFGQADHQDGPAAPSGLRAFGSAASAFDALPSPSAGRAMRGLDIHV